MNRRDLLLLRVDAGTTLVELDCARLYLRYLDTRRPGPPVTAWHEPCLGEPDANITVESTRELFDGLRRDLAAANVLRVLGPEWLANADLRHQVDTLVAAVHANGGRVEFSTRR